MGEKAKEGGIEGEEGYAIGRKLAGDRQHRPVAADHDRELRLASDLRERRGLVSRQRRVLRGVRIEQYAVPAAGQGSGGAGGGPFNPPAGGGPRQRAPWGR